MIRKDLKHPKEILEMEHYYSYIFNNMHDVIIVIDKNYWVVDVNKPACKKFKKQRDELIGRYCYEIMHMYDQPCSEIGYECPLLGVLKTGLPNEVQYQHKLPDNTTLWEDIITTPLKDAKGRVIYVIKAIRDVTDLLRMQEHLKETLMGITHSLTVLPEIKDPYMAGHQQRVAQLSCAIAKEMGFLKEQIEGIRMAALLHDIGKIRVPTEILIKPGKKSESEFNIIKTHPKFSYDILKEIKFEWPISQIILQHHERMDGSGYPQGLSGEDILLEARILGVADVVEAMSSHRPYRQAHSIDKTLEEISQNRDVLYDPEVVDACLKLFTEKGFKFM